jgi:hypothetical protein
MTMEIMLATSSLEPMRMTIGKRCRLHAGGARTATDRRRP